MLASRSSPLAQPAARRRGTEAVRLRALGFTLLELMIVITIILILLTLASGRYQQSVIRAREAALKQNLFVMRQAIDQYTLDKLEAPQSLEDLVAGGYIRAVPEDPMTKQRDWRLVYEDVLLSPEQRTAGLVDVHSNSDAISPFEHTPYSSW
jgi:general secretion pathway protein G